MRVEWRSTYPWWWNLLAWTSWLVGRFLPSVKPLHVFLVNAVRWEFRMPEGPWLRLNARLVRGADGRYVAVYGDEASRLACQIRDEERVQMSLDRVVTTA